MRGNLTHFLGSVVLAATMCLVAANASYADVVVSEKDAGKTIAVKLGAPLVVNLSGHIGSGYYWRLDGDLTPQLILSGRSTKALDIPDSPQVTSFVFTTAAPGQVEFKASNLKAGAPIPSTSDVTFTVNVVP